MWVEKSHMKCPEQTILGGVSTFEVMIMGSSSVCVFSVSQNVFTWFWKPNSLPADQLI